MNPAYLPLWVFGVSLSWLLPNHYQPWGTFHSEALIAIMFCIAGFMIGFKNTWCIPRIALLFPVLVSVIIIQDVMHIIYKNGTTWVTLSYFLGGFLCIIIGATWERIKPGQALVAILSSILVAALVTVGLQLLQWLNLSEILDIWSMGPSSGRPFGNIGQPNQTSTFLLWALVGIAWLNDKGVIRGSVAIFVSLFILWGIALTYSRTGWLGLGLLFLAAWYWRALWHDRSVPWVFTGLVMSFVGMVIAIGWLNTHLGFNSAIGEADLTRMSSEIRPAAWRLFIDAILHHPWFGFGANQVSWAQLSVAADNPPLYSTFGHAHNLFLDMALWFGIPIGLGFCLLLLIWFFKNFKKVYNTSHAWPILMILLVSAHAMLELPLHYAYFLFPTCFLFGIVSSNHNELILNDISKGSLQVVSFGITICLLSAAILLSLLVRDYSRVESSYEALRFEIARIQYKVRGTPPDVIMLNQWRDFIELARAEPIDLATAESLDKAQGTVATLSSPSVIYKLASALALADQPIEAQIWLVRLCKTQPPSQCQAVKSSWINKARLNSKMESVDWTQISTPQ